MNIIVCLKQVPDVDDIKWTKEVEYDPILRLDADLSVAMKKMQETRQIEKELPGVDCAACGSPSCRAFAEDVVAGTAKMSDCLLRLKNQLKDIIEK